MLNPRVRWNVPDELTTPRPDVEETVAYSRSREIERECRRNQKSECRRNLPPQPEKRVLLQWKRVLLQWKRVLLQWKRVPADRTAKGVPFELQFTSQ